MLPDFLTEIAIGESEDRATEFKGSIDLTSAGDWLEIVKDLVAMANSGGGTMIFGIDDNGQPSGFDCNPLLKLDPAVITDKVHKYTGQQFHALELRPLTKDQQDVFAIVVSGISVPLVFVKPGTYDIGSGKQKTAFSAGTVYFRHGAKSEPGNSEDLRMFFERRIEEVRKSWMDGIAKVVEAPVGSQIQVVPPGFDELTVSEVRLVDDLNASTARSISIDKTHPFRQKEVVEEINKALNGAKTIKAFNIQCVRRAHGIDANPTFCYKQRYASARYSQAFVDWVIQQHIENLNFFELAKAKADDLKRAVIGGT